MMMMILRGNKGKCNSKSFQVVVLLLLLLLFLLFSSAFILWIVQIFRRINFSMVIWPFFIFVFIMNGISLFFFLFFVPLSKTKPFSLLKRWQGLSEGHWIRYGYEEEDEEKWEENLQHIFESSYADLIAKMNYVNTNMMAQMFASKSKRYARTIA